MDDFDDKPPKKRRRRKVPKGLVPATVPQTFYLPDDEDDLIKLAEVAVPQLVRKSVALAAESDNLMAVLSVLKELTDRAHGKAQQSVTQTINLGEQQSKSLEEVARMMLFAQRDAKERSKDVSGLEVIDVEDTGEQSKLLVESNNEQKD